jgi:hypothetical protein
MKPIHHEFFATRGDLLRGALRLESDVKVQYVLMGMFPSPTPTRYSSAAEFEDLGVARHGDYNSEPRYMVLDADAEIRVREEPQKAGGLLYAIDLKSNPAGFLFQPGGRYADRTIIRGAVGTATGDPTSVAACRRFWRELRRGFLAVHRFFVGPEAYQLLEAGGRLTPSVQCPPDLDLRI